MPRRFLHPAIPLIMSLAIVAAVTVPAAYFLNQQRKENQRIEMLGSADPAERELALNFLITRGEDDPSIVESAIREMRTLPVDRVIEVYNALASIGQAEHRESVAVVLDKANAASLEDVIRLVQLLQQHGQASQPEVYRKVAARLRNAEGPAFEQLVLLLESIGGWSREHVADQPWLRWVRSSLEPGDLNSELITLGRLRDLPDLASQPATRELAGSLLESPHARVRYETLAMAAGFSRLDPTYETMVRSAAADPDAMTSGLAKRLIDLIDDQLEPAYPADPKWIGTEPAAVTLENYLEVWRAVLAAPATEDNAAWFATLVDELPRDPQELCEVALAARYRQGLPLPSFEIDQDDETAWRFALAAVEGSPDGSASLSFTDQMPHLLRPPAIRVATDARADWLYDTLRLDERASMRDLAVLFAARYFEPSQIDSLIARLLEDPDPHGRMSAAMLSGLTGRQLRLLHDWAGREQRFAVKRMMQVGLWMQGAAQDLTPIVPSLLGRAELPKSTLRLALLHGGQYQAALDGLLGPQADLSVLLELLGRERWWLVLDHYLPPQAPDLHLWSDGEVALDQLKAIQAWWILNRYDPAVLTTNSSAETSDAEAR